MKPLTGIVPKNDVPPTFEIHPLGAMVRFFRHSPRLIRFEAASLRVDILNAYNDRVWGEFSIKVNKKTVVISLTEPEMGHGTIKLDKDELIQALKQV